MRLGPLDDHYGISVSCKETDAQIDVPDSTRRVEESSGFLWRAGLREWSQEKPGVLCRQVPSQMYLWHLNQWWSGDMGLAREEPVTLPWLDVGIQMTAWAIYITQWFCGPGVPLCVVIQLCNTLSTRLGSHTDVSLHLASGQQTSLSASVQSSKCSLATSTKRKSQSQPATLMVGRQTAKAPLPRQSRSSAKKCWCATLSRSSLPLLVNLHSEAFYQAGDI